jgi:large subunit ribosomal protein L15
MPVYRRLPKRGFVNIFRKSFSEINLGDLQKAIDNKVLKADAEINEVVLMEAGMIKKVKDGVRLLGKGELKTKLTIKVVGATKSAIEAVEKLGGSVIVNPIKKTVLEKGKKTSKKEPAKKTTKKTK